MKPLEDRHIHIDNNAKCTLECPKCLRQTLRRRNLPIPGQDLSVKDFIKLIDYWKGAIFCGQLSDPIFNPNLIEFIKICKEKNKPCEIHTAATSKKHTKEWYKRAFEANLDCEWVFGIDGMPHQSFVYRINQDGEFLFEMAKLAKEVGVKSVIWQYIIFGYNEDYIEQAKELAKENNIILDLNFSARWNKKNDPYKPKNTKHIHPQLVLDQVKSAMSDKSKPKEKKKLKPKCIQGHQNPALTATGYILPCCWIDNDDNWKEPEVKKLMTKKISDVENVEDIVKGKEWNHFMNLLKTEGVGIPKACWQKCTNSVKINMTRTKQRINETKDMRLL